MCQAQSIKLLLLESMRHQAHGSRNPELVGWLRNCGLSDLIPALVGLVEGARPGLSSFALPGSGAPWPLEEALLTAVKAAATEPENLRCSLAQCLPPAACHEAELLLSETSSCLICFSCRQLRDRRKGENLHPAPGH